jgi:lipocalin
LRFDFSHEKGCECGHATYTLNSDHTVGVKNCCKKPDGNSCSIGRAVLGDPDHEPLEGKLNVTFGPPRELSKKSYLAFTLLTLAYF